MLTGFVRISFLTLVVGYFILNQLIYNFMAVKKVITSFETENELSVFINGSDFLTITIETNKYDLSVFCFEEISNAEDFLILLRDKIIEYKEYIKE